MSKNHFNEMPFGEEEEAKRMPIILMRMEILDFEIAYAFQKTGLLPAPENRRSITPKRLQAWRKARAEGKELKKTLKSREEQIKFLEKHHIELKASPKGES